MQNSLVEPAEAEDDQTYIDKGGCAYNNTGTNHFALGLC